MAKKRHIPLLYGPDGRPLALQSVQSKEPTTKRQKKANGRKEPTGLIRYKQWFSPLRSAFLGIAGIVAFFATVISLVPRVSVSASDPVEIGNPFSASFTVTPSNIFPLRKVGALLDIVEITVSPSTFNEHKRPRLTNELSGFTTPEWNNHNLKMDEKFTINLYGAIVVGDMRPAGTGADIAIVVDYQPWFIPIRRRQIFRFVTQHFADGSFRWSSYPMD